ncbi:hypothetical protein P7C70_g5482, partial [Phenoliferia sp. Uapishka_3]
MTPSNPPLPSAVAGDNALLSKLDHHLSEQAHSQHITQPVKIHPSGTIVYDFTGVTDSRVYAIHTLNMTRLSAHNPTFSIVASYSCAMGLLGEESEIVPLDADDEVRDQWFPNLVDRRVKNGTTIHVPGVGYIMIDLLILDPRCRGFQFIIDVYKRSQCLTFVSAPLAVQIWNSQAKNYRRGVVRLRQIAYKVKDASGRLVVDAATDPARKLIKLPAYDVVGTVWDVQDKATKVPVESNPYSRYVQDKAPKVHVESNFFSHPTREPVLGKSNSKASLLNPSEASSEATLVAKSHRKRKSRSKDGSHGHAPETSNLFNYNTKLRKEDDWRAEATPDPAPTVNQEMKYPGSRLPRLPSKPVPKDLSEVERRLALAKALETAPTAPTHDTYFGPRFQGIPRTDPISMATNDNGSLLLRGPQAQPGVPANRPLAAAPLAPATTTVSPNDTTLIAHREVEPMIKRNDESSTAEMYVRLPYTPCNSPVNILYGNTSARLGRIGSGDFDHAEALRRRDQNEREEARSVQQLNEIIEAGKASLAASRSNLVSTFEDVMAERRAYLSRLQAPVAPLVDDQPVSPVFSRCISPPSFSPYSRQTRVKAADLNDFPRHGDRFANAFGIGSSSQYSTYATVAAPTAIYSLGYVGLLSPVAERKALEEGECREKEAIESPGDGLIATNPDVVGRENATGGPE